MHVSLITEQDQSLWDAYVLSHPDTSPYHLYAWRQACESAYGLTCYYFAARNDSGIVGVLPLAQINPPFSKSKGVLCSLPYCDLGAPLADDTETKQALLTAAFELAQRLGISRLDIRDTHTTADSRAEEPAPGSKVRMVLKLPESAEVLAKSYKAKRRSQIRKAEKNGVSFHFAQDAAAIDDFYDVISRNMHALGSPTHSLKWFQAIHRHFKDNLKLGIVSYDNQVIGAAALLLSGKTATVPWASTLSDFNHLAPNMLLYWGLLEFTANNGFMTFDFGRSTVGEGTYKFKKQWGAQPVALDWQQFQPNGQHILITPSRSSLNRGSSNHRPSKIRSMIEKLWRQLPLPVSIFLGSKIRRYISL